MSVRRTKKNKTGIHRIVGILFSLLVVTGFALISTATPNNASLPYLHPPGVRTYVSYSGPLTLQTVNASVLGAEPIDPIDFIREINTVRLSRGSPALRLNKTLMEAARLRADTIMKHQNFSHQDPYDGIELLTVLPKLEYHYAYASENIGMGGESAAGFVTGFMNSTSHRNNLLDPRLTETGAAIVSDKFGTQYVNLAVQLFAIPGGTDEERGYTDRDIDEYQSALSAVNGKLNPVTLLSDSVLYTWTFDRSSYDRLVRQKEILETILAKMHNNETLGSTDVTLVLEYDSLL